MSWSRQRTSVAASGSSVNSAADLSAARISATVKGLGEAKTRASSTCGSVIGSAGNTSSGKTRELSTSAPREANHKTGFHARKARIYDDAGPGTGAAASF